MVYLFFIEYIKINVVLQRPLGSPWSNFEVCYPKCVSALLSEPAETSNTSALLSSTLAARIDSFGWHQDYVAFVYENIFFQLLCYFKN
jgi:hypothetical protein